MIFNANYLPVSLILINKSQVQSLHPVLFDQSQNSLAACLLDTKASNSLTESQKKTISIMQLINVNSNLINWS